MRLERVMDEANALAAAGYREIVLSGINLGQWGRDFQPQQRFGELLRSLLEFTDIAKIRISSVEPMDWNDGLTSLVAASSRIANHALFPLQSCSDPILRRIHPPYPPLPSPHKIKKIPKPTPHP